MNNNNIFTLVALICLDTISLVLLLHLFVFPFMTVSCSSLFAYFMLFLCSCFTLYLQHLLVFPFCDILVFLFVCLFHVCHKSCICNICWFFLFVTFSCSGISTSALATTNMSDVRPCSFQRQIVFFSDRKDFL